MIRSTGTSIHFEPSPGRRFVISAILAVLALSLGALAFFAASVRREFKNPIAFALVDDSLYVVEKANNTILRLEYDAGIFRMTLEESARVEPDEGEYYFMVRKLHHGRGLVTKSNIYRRDTDDFVGYRYLEYPEGNLNARPLPIFTVFPDDPKSYPEVHYARGADGAHFFVNDCAGAPNLWIVEPSGGVVMRGSDIPPELRMMGETNGAFCSWAGITVATNGHILVASASKEQVVEYSPDGQRLRDIGAVGFDEGCLLAPAELSFVRTRSDAQALLTVASTGNRSWVRFSEDGRPALTINPLEEGCPFPDILVGPLYVHSKSGETLGFDLVNRGLVALDRGFTSITSYQARQPCAAASLAAAALVCLLLSGFFATKRRVRSRLKFPFFLKLLLLFMPILAISNLIVGDWVRDSMKADLEAESVRRSSNLARAILNTVSLSDLESIQLPEDREGEAYKRVFDAVSRIMDARDAEYMPKWIIHKIRDGRFYFGINVWRGPIYEPFIVPIDRTIFFEAVREKTSRFGRFTDEQGEWFSYLQPILNAEGEVIYLLELYRPTEEIDRTDRKAQWRVAAIAGSTLLFAALIAFIFSYIFTRPLAALTLAAKTVSRGDFEHRINIRSHDEIGELARDFNRMVGDLKQYTEDLARATAEQERIQSELRFAHEMQQNVLPRRFPPFPEAPNLEIFARMEPAREIGGDFYDFFLVDENHMGVVIADVSGKGTAAGLFMMAVRTLLRNNAINNLSAAAAMSRTNRIIAADNPSNMFATVFYFICDMRTGRVIFCNAGHNPPLLLRKRRDQVNEIAQKGARSIVLGVMDDATYSDAEMLLEEDDTLILYTDGVTEPINRNCEMFGEAALMDGIKARAGLPNKDICDSIFRDVARHQEGLEQFDDITLLFFRFAGNAQS